MKKLLLSIVLLVVFCISSPSNSHAIILFQDNFESGLSNWTTSGIVSTSSLFPSPGGGDYAFLAGTIFNRTPYMFTSLSTVGYDSLNVSFLANTHFMDDPNDRLLAGYSLNGTTWQTVNLPRHWWQEYNFALPTETYNQPNLYLGFRLASHGGFFDVDFAEIDDVTLSGQNIIPEPASVFLFSGGILGLLARRRRKA